MKAPPPHTGQLPLGQLLFSQGFGTRRECAALARSGQVSVGGQVVVDARTVVQIAEGEPFHVAGQPWPYHASAVVMLHKPAGVECSLRPGRHPSVQSLLPTPLRRRGLQPVGRLDVDTTGLLLLCDDGALTHRLIAPKHKVAKLYEVTTRHPLDGDAVRRLLDGVVLDDDPRPVRAAACELRGERDLALTLTQGRYHQVKRMVAAIGNRVEALHRSAFGGLTLPRELAPGQ